MAKTPKAHVMKSWNDIRQANGSHVLNQLTEHHSILYYFVKENKKIFSNDLWKLYLEKCKEGGKRPISTRTFPVYVNKLRDAGLINISRAPVKGDNTQAKGRDLRQGLQ